MHEMRARRRSVACILAAFLFFWSVAQCLAANCVDCGKELPALAKFCAFCGAQVSRTDGEPAEERLSVEEIVRRCRPAVVLIESRDKTGRMTGALGSGFIVDPNGVVITNNHVIEGGEAFFVKLANGHVYKDVQVVATLPAHDLAVLKVKGKNMPALPVGDTVRVQVGEAVVVIGNPFGMEGTVTDGVVSGRQKLGSGLEAFLISAPVSPGNSGGPVINSRGEVIAVATASHMMGQNLNLAMPISYARSALAQSGSDAGKTREAPRPELQYTAAQSGLVKEYEESLARIQESAGKIVQDVIHMKGGRKLEGTIIARTADTMTIRIVGLGEIGIPAEKVESVEEAPEGSDEAAARLAEERDETIAKYRRLMQEEGLVKYRGMWVQAEYVSQMLAWQEQERERKERERELEGAAREREAALAAAKESHEAAQEAVALAVRATEYYNKGIFYYNGAGAAARWSAVAAGFDEARRWLEKALPLYEKAARLSPEASKVHNLDLKTRISETKRAIQKCKTLAKQARRAHR